MQIRRLLLLFALLWTAAIKADDVLVVIGHPSLPKADLATLQRLYTGRAVSLGPHLAIPLNLPTGHPVRLQFLDNVMGQNEEQYTGYWLVRRYVGKGVPPQEVADIDELLRTVIATPGALGYVPLSKVPAGSNVIFKR